MTLKEEQMTLAEKNRVENDAIAYELTLPRIIMED